MRDKPRTIRQLGFAEGRNLPLAQRKQVAALLPEEVQIREPRIDSRIGEQRVVGVAGE